jgi:hypothetical protein
VGERGRQLVGRHRLGVVAERVEHLLAGSPRATGASRLG